MTIPTSAHVWDTLAGSSVAGPLVGRAQVQAFVLQSHACSPAWVDSDDAA
jgi:hypothetical protein